MALEESGAPFPICICLTGIKHCGKTTVGKLLAEERGVPFFDLDTLVETACADETGSSLSCRGIYREYGKPNFQYFETAAARRLGRLAGPESREAPHGGGSGISGVAALGGGTVENREAMTVIESFGLFILLDANPEELFERIKRGGIPPFLSTSHGPAGGGIERERDIYERFLELYNRRMKLYLRQADIVIDTRGKTPSEIAGEAARETSRRLQRREPGRKE